MHRIRKDSDAVEALAKGEIPEEKHSAGIGSRLVKYEAEDLAIGRRPFIDDIQVGRRRRVFFSASMLGPIPSIDVGSGELRWGCADYYCR